MPNKAGSKKKREEQARARIIFDCNIIYSQDKNEICSKEMQQFLTVYSRNPKLKLEIPEIVLLELTQQHKVDNKKLLDYIHRYRTQIKKRFGLDRQYKLPSEKLYKAIETKITKWIKRNRITVIDMPIARLTVDDLIFRAVERIPPFDKDGAKGLKDTIIFLSIEELVKSTNDLVIFVCNDKVLYDALNIRHGDRRNFKLFEDLNGLKAYLDKYLKEYELKWLNTVEKRAKTLFYDQIIESSDNLYQKFKIAGLIEEHVAKYRDEKGFDHGLEEQYLPLRKWKAKSSGQSWIFPPVINDRRNAVFEFKSKIVFKILVNDITEIGAPKYSQGASWWDSILGPTAKMSVMPIKQASNTAFLDALLAVSRTYVFSQEFHVYWNAKVTSRPAFRNLTFSRIEPGRTLISVATESDIEELSDS